MHDPYSVTHIYEALAGSVLPLKPSELLVVLRDQAGMSSATFWRLWKIAMKHPDITIAPTGHISCGKGFNVPAREVIERIPKRKSKKVNGVLVLTPAKAAARKMPPLIHHHKDQPFDINDSDVVAWLISQPEIKYSVWYKYRDQLVYDPESGKWTGLDFDKKEII